MSAPRPWLALLRRVLPFVIGALLLLWIFWRVPLGKFADSLKTAEFGWFLPAMAVTMIGIYLADSFAISATFTWFTAELGFKEVLPIRGASYLLSILNYNLGQGAIVIFVNRSRGVRLAVATGTVLLLMGIQAVVLLLLATVGVFGAGSAAAAAWRPVVIGGLVAFTLYLGLVSFPPGWLHRRALMGPAVKAGLGGHLLAVLVRIPHICLVFLAHYLGMRAFGIDPPVMTFLVLMPIVALASALPISPQGLGTTQVAAVYFFAPFAPGATAGAREAQVLAYSITISVLAILFMLGMGAVWFRRGLKLLRLESGDEAAT